MQRFRRRKKTYQMSKVSLYHELECLGGTRGVSGDHGIPSHDRTHGCSPGLESFCRDLDDTRLIFFFFVVFKKMIRTRYARSFAVNIPQRPSSSSTTRTQSVRFAAQSWLASDTVMVCGTVNAGLGLRAATVPLATVGLRPFWLRKLVVEMVRLRESSDSIFFRIA